MPNPEYMSDETFAELEESLNQVLDHVKRQNSCVKCRCQFVRADAPFTVNLECDCDCHESEG